MKLGLGTVQFGLDYGISNSAGRTPPREVRAILELAAAEGVRVLDTAPAYGRSEEVLGQSMSAADDFAIVTKTPEFHGGTITASHADLLRRTFGESLRKLRRPRLYGLLAHHADDLLAPGGERLMQAMLELKQQGLVSKVGASVYNGLQIDAIMQRHAIDLVQLPLSVLDQRLLASGHLRKLKQAGVEVHARSVFLQGLLLMPVANLPRYFDPLRSHLANYHAYLEAAGIPPMRAALDFALGLAEVDHVILGVNSRLQLQEILSQQAGGGTVADWRRFAFGDAAMLDPSQWRLS